MSTVVDTGHRGTPAGTSARYRIGIDVGGTFTDVVCQDARGAVRLMKIPTSRSDPSVAIASAIEQMRGDWGVHPTNIEAFMHGTTAGTNAVLERKGARIGLITTEGFRDVLEIGRQMRHRMYDMVLNAETPGFLAPGRYRKEVAGRVAADGSILVALDEDAVAKAVDELVADGVEAIAVCLLFSFINPAHEKRVGEIIAERWPTLMYSLSSEVDPTFREYERTVVTSFDAYVKPVLDRYLENLETRLTDAGVQAPLQVMQSRGGICSSTVARRRPVRLFLSGPAAGVIGARMVGQEVGIEDLITVDIGGTSCDISLISAAKPVIRAEGLIDGYPVRVPMVDVNAIGSGGGSIAWLDASGMLRVGPSSAGSEPGPACYGRGGENPTVTDASVVLGYINPDNFAGGTFRLNAELAYRAIRDRIARPMGLSVQAAALGIHRVVNAQMAEGIRMTSIRRGFDPRRFSLMPLGGGGALHATALASDLGIQSVIVPRNPGVLCAQGLLAAPIEHEMTTAFPAALADADTQSMQRALQELDTRLDALMRVEGLDKDGVQVQHLADMCYIGQSYHLEIPLRYEAGQRIDAAVLDRLYQDFLAAHTSVYGHSTDAPAKVVNLRAVHQAMAKRPVQAGVPDRTAPSRIDPQAPTQREILVAGTAAPVLATVIARDQIVPSVDVVGPAVVEQVDTTILIEPGWIASAGANGNLIIRRMTADNNARTLQ